MIFLCTLHLQMIFRWRSLYELAVAPVVVVVLVVVAEGEVDPLYLHQLLHYLLRPQHLLRRLSPRVLLMSFQPPTIFDHMCRRDSEARTRTSAAGGRGRGS